MDQDSSLPKNLSGLLTRVNEKRSQDIADQTALTSTALVKLGENLQMQSTAALDSTSKHLDQATQELESNVGARLTTVQSNMIESLGRVEIAHDKEATALLGTMDGTHNFLEKVLIGNTNKLSRQMHETVQLPATDLAATVEKATATLTQADKQADRLLRLAKMMVLGALAVCLVACAGIWAYWKWVAPWSSLELNGKVYQVLEPGWYPCHPPQAQATQCKLVK